VFKSPIFLPLRSHYNTGKMAGKIYAVGIGPGSLECLSPQASNAIADSQVVVGYKMYVDLISDLVDGKETVASGMMKETERCSQAIEHALAGKTVSLISSGDAGVYGMAGILLEMAQLHSDKISVEVVPGITSALASASLLGAPLMNDYVSISLSDLLTPWDVIEKRLHAAGAGDFAVCLYNPRSKGRPDHLKKACEILLQYKAENTPVGMVKNAMREEQEIWMEELGSVDFEKVDMTTTVVIGNSQTKVLGKKLVTARGYEKKYEL